MTGLYVNIYVQSRNCNQIQKQNKVSIPMEVKETGVYCTYFQIKTKGTWVTTSWF